MKVRELIAQLQDDIDPEAEVTLGAFAEPVRGLETGRRLSLLDEDPQPYVRLL